MTSLGNLPLFIVSAAGFLNMPFIQDEAARQRMQHLWNELQADLSHLSDNCQTLYVKKSSHFVQRDDQASVVLAIEALLAKQARMIRLAGAIGCIKGTE